MEMVEIEFILIESRHSYKYSKIVSRTAYSLEMLLDFFACILSSSSISDTTTYR